MVFHAARPYLLLTACLMAAHAAGAAPKKATPYTGGLAVGFSQFEYQQRLDAPLTFDVATVNLTAGWEKSYIAFDLTQDISAADISERQQIGRAGQEKQDISLGYRLGQRLWFFAGETTDKTTLHLVSRRNEEQTREFYEQEGLFYGLAYIYPFKSNGLLKFNVTYSDLDTENEFGSAPAQYADPGTIEFSELGGRRKGTSEGYGYGVTWVMPLSQTLYYEARYAVSDHEQRVNVDDLLDSGRVVDHSADIATRTFTMGFKVLFE